MEKVLRVLGHTLRAIMPPGCLLWAMHYFPVCMCGCEVVGVNGPLVVGGSPNMTQPRVQVWGGCLEKVWRVLGDILMAIIKGPQMRRKCCTIMGIRVRD